MPARFQAAVHRRDEITYLKLSGVVDEDNDLDALVEQVAAGKVVIDLGEVQRINSCGVRDWVKWLGAVAVGGRKVYLVECSPAIVAQVNLVHNFTAHAMVKSFYAPYFCASCDREKLLLVETRDVDPTLPFHAPSCRCDECDGPMDFDDMEESYFAFLRHASKIASDARVDEVVTEFTPSDGGPKLRTRATGTGAPLLSPATQVPALVGAGPSSLPSVPSLPSLPSIRKLAESYAAGSGRGVPAGAPSPSPAQAIARSDKAIGAAGGGSVAVASPSRGHGPIASAPQLSASASTHATTRVWLAVCGVLLVAAVVVAWLALARS